MAVLFTNNAASTLAAGITSGQTSIDVAAGTGLLFPSPSGGDFFYATIVNVANTIEIVKCTARSTDTLTVVRAQEGTTGTAYLLGDRIELRVTAAGLANKLDKDTGGTVAGNLAVTGTLAVDGNATLGNAGGDSVTFNASTFAAPNNVTATGSWSFASLAQNSVPVVTTTGSQTLTNKTLTSPTLTGPIFGTISNTGTITLPTATTTLVGRDTTDTLTNKTLTGIAVGSTVNDNASGAFAIGYKDIPQHAVSGTTTLALEDRGKHIYATSSTYSVTIPPNSSVAFPTGTAVSFVNNGSGSITIAQGSGVTLVWSPTGATGSRTLAQYGFVTALKVATDTWFISGAGLT